MASSLKFELFFIYLFLPLFILIFQSKILIFTVLYLVFIFTFLELRKDKSFKSKVLSKKINWRISFIFFLVFLIFGYFYVLFYDPTLLFSFPKNNFLLWVTVMFIYPFFSVIPQEIVYRVYFYQRYKKLFNGNLLLLTLLNLFFFSFAHIVFNNPHAILITAIASPIFSYLYIKESFFTCVLVHSLGGQIIFTLGLGRYFY